MEYNYNLYTFALDYTSVCFPYVVNSSQLITSKNGKVIGIEDIHLLETQTNLNGLTQFY